MYVPWFMYVHNIVIREIIIVYKRGAYSIWFRIRICT